MRPSQMTWEASNFTHGEKKKKAKQNTTPDIVTASMLHWELLIGFKAPLQYSRAPPDCTLSIQAHKIASDLWTLSDQFTKNNWSGSTHCTSTKSKDIWKWLNDLSCLPVLVLICPSHFGGHWAGAKVWFGTTKPCAVNPSASKLSWLGMISRGTNPTNRFLNVLKGFAGEGPSLLLLREGIVLGPVFV